MFSDDLGQTWHLAQFDPTVAGSHQNMGILPMPDAIRFASDISPNGIHRITRGQGKHTDAYTIDVPHTLNDEPFRTHTGQGIFWTGIDGHPAFFEFGAETNPAPSAIVATRDGLHFETVWEDENISPASRGLRSVVGPTVRGQLFARLQDTENQPQSWMRLKRCAPATDARADAGLSL